MGKFVSYFAIKKWSRPWVQFLVAPLPLKYHKSNILLNPKQINLHTYNTINITSSYHCHHHHHHYRHHYCHHHLFHSHPPRCTVKEKLSQLGKKTGAKVRIIMNLYHNLCKPEDNKMISFKCEHGEEYPCQSRILCAVKVSFKNKVIMQL